MLEQLANLVVSTPSQSELSLQRQLWFRVFQYEHLVEQREQELRFLLSSPAWRFTKYLRELKAWFSGAAASPVLAAEPTVQTPTFDSACVSSPDSPALGLADVQPVRSIEASGIEGESAVSATADAYTAVQEVLEQHKAYLREMRRQIVAVRRSLSMRLIALFQRPKT